MSRKRARTLAWLIFIGYTSCLLYWMFLGFGRGLYQREEFAYNVVPFRTIGMYVLHIHAFPLRTWIINLFGNIGVFMPFGFLLPYLFPLARRYSWFLLLFGCPLAGLEVLQMLLRVGSLDVDDVILNVLGASLAFMVFRGLWRVLERRKANPMYKM
ncbi:VanZ family protein [Paenibacillus sp. HWE-109]|uniref:VanZ family protein n=1 Tax=Paenibacillus sp. HWE-109 TaxID=1306526 RepID=UPI001EDDFD41|nr:VanZ family protein [Paenibacillus sp. HWE-109]UKS25747.1 VanZ family protein [Paenibacillus sp. HWE-109]